MVKPVNQGRSTASGLVASLLLQHTCQNRESALIAYFQHSPREKLIVDRSHIASDITIIICGFLCG